MMSSISTWGSRHVQAFLGSLGRLVRNPLGTTFTVLVIALALSLPAGLKVLVGNARLATGDFENAVDLSVFFKPDVPLEKARQLARSARGRSGVAAVELISSAQGLAEFRRYSGFGAALDALEGNPLPHVLKIRPDPAASMPNEVEALKRYLSSWPEVDVVSVDTDWVRRFNAILEVLRSLLVVASAVLAVGVLAVIGNTIRLEILNRRPEIEVTKLVGGTNAFVRRPFLYTGVLYGVAGALLAWAIVATSIAALAGPTAGLARAYGSRFELVGLGAADVGALLLGGMLLGLGGAWISSARHLARIEPKA